MLNTCTQQTATAKHWAEGHNIELTYALAVTINFTTYFIIMMKNHNDSFNAFFSTSNRKKKPVREISLIW